MEEPRNSGSCACTESLAGNCLASVTATGRETLEVASSAVTVSVCVPILASFGTSRRRSKDTLSSVAAMIAATGWPPPSSVAVQPCGTPETESLRRSRREPVIAQLQIDGRGGARLYRNRRIIGEEIKPLHIGLGGGVVGGEGRRGERKTESGECKQTESHGYPSRAVAGP